MYTRNIMPSGANDYFRHIPGAQLEGYALRRLLAPETAAVEEHLLVCEDCRDGLHLIDEMIAAMRAADVKTAGSDEQD